MIKLYVQDISPLFDGAWRSFLPLLPPERRARAQRFRQDADVARCVGAWLLLRSAFSREGVDIDPLCLKTGAQGKPYFEGQPAFSISHTGPYAALALSREPVGVDMEAARCTMRVARGFFSSAELSAAERLSGGEQSLYLQRLWVAKEAFVKALGTGLATPLRSFSVVLDGASASLVQDISPLPFRITEYSEGAYRIAVVGIGPAERMELPPMFGRE